MSDPTVSPMFNPLRPVPPPGATMKCSACGEVRPHRLYSRRLDQAVCQRCYDAGRRLIEKEG